MFQKIKIILNNLLLKFRNFLLNVNSLEFDSKLTINNIKETIIKKGLPSYILDGYKVYSQNDEDGIINSIFNDIGVTNKLFCEIGIGDTVENNTHNLLLNDWTGLWIDINGKHIKKLKKKISKNQNKLDFIINKITPTNINQFIISSEKIRKNNEIDFFSIDIDSYDLQCLEQLDAITPRLICVEYNSKIRQNIKLKINEIKNFKWEYDDYFGSSLLSINSIMDKKGYKLVATNITGSNAFYVKKELSVLTKTNNQNIKDLYSPPNFELFNFNVTHAPTNKYLINKLNE